MNGIFDSVGVWFGWVSSQWWFWILVILIALGIVVFLSILLWGAVLALGRWSFSTWPRGLIAAPVFVMLIVLLIANAGSIFQWVSDYWPLTMVPTLIVVALPLIFISGLFSSGGSSTSERTMVCSRCGSSVCSGVHDDYSSFSFDDD